MRLLAARVGAGWRLVASDARPWASATFAGERHRFLIESEAAALAGIGEWELPIAGHFVGDIAVVGEMDGRLRIEALTVATE